MDSNDTSKCSIRSDENKENLSISEDERDIIDGTGFLSDQHQIGDTQFRNRNIATTRTSDSPVEIRAAEISPTTAILLRENNQVLCPLSRKDQLRRYRGSFAKLTFVSPNGEFEDETTASYATAHTKLLDEDDRGRIICTCCTQCKFCRRLSSFCHQNWMNAGTQTDLLETKTAETEIGSSLGSGKSMKANDTKADVAASKVVCTYLAEASDEFYPFSRAETRQPAQVSEAQPETQVPPITNTPISCTPVSREQKIRRLRFCSKRSTAKIDCSSLFLRYLKLLILRQKEKFRQDFWRAYASEFESPICLTAEEVETCRRRFGDGYDIDQLERMFPSALKSSTGEWRRQMQQHRSDASEQMRRYVQPSQVTCKTSTDQYIRLDKFRSQAKTSTKTPAVKESHIPSLRLAPHTSTSPISGVLNTGLSTTPSKLRPIKLNRAAVLRADAIFSKYWVTP